MEKITREQAKLNGSSRYFTGEPCSHGHVSPRRTINRSCVACIRESDIKKYKITSDSLEFRLANRKRATEWAKKNPEKYAARQTKWRSENREHKLAVDKKWQANNRERYNFSLRVGNINRRTRQKANGGRCTQADLRALLAAHPGICPACKRVSNRWEIDHIIPIVKGGSSDPSNLQILCKPCNRAKHAKDPVQWTKSLGS